MRGKAVDDGHFGFFTRITPAYAGKRVFSSAVSRCSWDHPRVCGEKLMLCHRLRPGRGSPPRVRGKAWRLPAAPGTQGITPACAGKSGPISASGRAIRDHPRVCGEKALHDGGILPAQGSPPRVRGKVFLPFVGSRHTGITPACAGKSFSAVRWQPSHGDHPRVCGEKYSLACCFWPASGSPPRVRGKGVQRDCPLVGMGITPACAGKSAYLSPEDTAGRDHPRVCGEKRNSSSPDNSYPGSPPRVRGKGRGTHSFLPFSGITPACAGKSGVGSGLDRPNRDHPRVCGEK